MDSDGAPRDSPRPGDRPYERGCSAARNSILLLWLKREWLMGKSRAYALETSN